LGASAIKRAHYVLSQFLARAVSDRLLVANPASGAKLPRTQRKRPVYLSHEQVGALASAAGECEALVLLLAYTGLRWGEAVALRVGDLDLLRRRATVARNAVQAGRTIHVGGPKNHKRRSVPLPAHDLRHVAASLAVSAGANVKAIQKMLTPPRR
jgi:integrase